MKHVVNLRFTGNIKNLDDSFNQCVSLALNISTNGAASKSSVVTNSVL